MHQLAKTLLCLFLLGGSGLLQAQEAPPLSNGQVLYLPVYSQIWHGNFEKNGKPYLLPMSVLVSIRNVDPKHPIRIVSARYTSTDGTFLRDYLASPKVLAPLATTELLVERREDMGGSGANFLIRWQASVAVNPPLVEAVHAELQGTRAIAFITSAKPVRTE